MKFGTVTTNGEAKPVLWIAKQTLLDLRWAVARAINAGQAASPITLQPSLMNLREFIALGSDALRSVSQLARLPREKLTGGLIDARNTSILAPIPRPSKNVFCVGRNYLEHIEEDNQSRKLATPPPEAPQFFTKPPTSIVGPGAPVRLDPNVTRRLDYEVELAVVIGKTGRDIPAETAFDHVFGYSIVNDVSARDLQRRHDQWFKGKAIDGSCPFGPWIVHKSAIPDPQSLRITLSINGQLRQSSNTDQMIFKIPEIIASLSAGLTLEPGDIIATGTPSGVGFAMNPRCFLQGGDVMTCSVEHIGTLENAIVVV